MKHCPTCLRTYTDETVKFCRVDGVTLVNASAELSESEATRVLPESRGTGEAPTEAFRNTGEGKLTTSALKPGPAAAAIGPARRSMSGRKLALIVVLVVLVFVVPIVIVVAGYISYRHARNTEVAIDSIAVLPFENQNRDASVEWLSDGVTESIINSLTQLPNLKVIARSSVFRYKGKQTDPFVVGKELGVRAVLVGRMMQRGDSINISTELVDVRDNKQLWGEQYERKASDLMSLQRDIAGQIANNLRLTISGEAHNRMMKHYTENPEAYQLYLKGRYFWNRRTPDDFKKAIVYFQQAIEKDPGYALAYSGLSDAYNLLSVYGANLPRETMPQAKEAAARALSLDNNLAEAHASMGQYLMNYQFDWSGAERELRRATELNPNYATAHQWLGEVLAAVGRADESLLEARRAMELDPLSQVINLVYGSNLLFARRYDEAIVQYKKTIDLKPEWPEAHKWIYYAYASKGMYAEAVTEYLKGQTLSSEAPAEIQAMQESFVKSGWHGFLQHRADYLAEKSTKQYVAADDIVDSYAQLGDREKAFAWLERAYQDRQQGLSQLKVAAKFDNLRTDPRFVDLLRRMGL